MKAHGVVGAAEARDRIEEITTSRHVPQALRLLDHHSATATWRVTGSSKFERSPPLHRALHVGDFFRALVDQENDQ